MSLGKTSSIVVAIISINYYISNSNGIYKDEVQMKYSSDSKLQTDFSCSIRILNILESVKGWIKEIRKVTNLCLQNVSWEFLARKEPETKKRKNMMVVVGVEYVQLAEALAPLYTHRKWIVCWCKIKKSSINNSNLAL